MEILNREFPDSSIARIVSDIKQKPELRALDEAFVTELLVKELTQAPKLIDFILKHEPRTLDRSEKYKKLIKSVRAKLRKTYGMFLTKEFRKQKRLLHDLREAVLKTDIPMHAIEKYKALLRTHVSTKERLDIYPELYWKIWEITAKPRKVIDISAGLNPFSFPWMGLNNVDYLATELNKTDVDLLNEYFEFKRFGLYGLAIQLDLQQAIKRPEMLQGLPKSDVCFLFKVLDTLEEFAKGHKASEVLIANVPVRWVVASFPTRTIGGKRSMSSKKRTWIEQMCKRLGYTFKHFVLKNEAFYVIDKQP
jgi:hypothetical protein